MSKRRAFGAELSVSDVNASIASKQQQPVKKKAKTSVAAETASGLINNSIHDDSSMNSQSQDSSMSQNSTSTEVASKASTGHAVAAAAAASKPATKPVRRKKKFLYDDPSLGFPREKTAEEKFLEAETPVINNTRRAKQQAKKEPNPPPDLPPPNHPQQVIRNKYAAARALAAEEEHRNRLKQLHLKKREPETPPTPPGSIGYKRKYESRAHKKLQNKAKAERKEQAKQVLNEKRQKARKDFWLQGIMHTQKMEEEKMQKERLAAVYQKEKEREAAAAAASKAAASPELSFSEKYKGMEMNEVLESIFSSPEYETSSEDESESNEPPVVTKKRKQDLKQCPTSNTSDESHTSDKKTAAKGKTASTKSLKATATIGQRGKPCDKKKVNDAEIHEVTQDLLESQMVPDVQSTSPSGSEVRSPSTQLAGATPYAVRGHPRGEATPMPPQRPAKFQAENIASPSNDKQCLEQNPTPPGTSLNTGSPLGSVKQSANASPFDDSPLDDIATSPRRADALLQSDVALRSFGDEADEPETFALDSPDKETSAVNHPSQRSEEEAAKSLLKMLETPAPPTKKEQKAPPLQQKQLAFDEILSSPTSTDSSTGLGSPVAQQKQVHCSGTKGDIGGHHDKNATQHEPVGSPEHHDQESFIPLSSALGESIAKDGPDGKTYAITLTGEETHNPSSAQIQATSEALPSESALDHSQTEEVEKCDGTVDSSFTLKPIPTEDPLRNQETPADNPEILNLLLRNETMPWGARKSTTDMLIGLDLEFRKVQSCDDSDVSDDSFDDEDFEQEQQGPTKTLHADDFKTPCVPITTFDVSGQTSFSSKTGAQSSDPESDPKETLEVTEPEPITASTSPATSDGTQPQGDDKKDPVDADLPDDDSKKPVDTEQPRPTSDQPSTTNHLGGNSDSLMNADDIIDSWDNYQHGQSPEHMETVEENWEEWTAETAGMNGMLPVFQLANGKWYRHPRLPPGWELGVSRSMNRPYYSHPDLGRTFYPPVRLASHDDDGDDVTHVPFGSRPANADLSPVAATPMSSTGGPRTPSTASSSASDTPSSPASRATSSRSASSPPEENSASSSSLSRASDSSLFSNQSAKSASSPDMKSNCNISPPNQLSSSPARSVLNAQSDNMLTKSPDDCQDNDSPGHPGKSDDSCTKTPPTETSEKNTASPSVHKMSVLTEDSTSERSTMLLEENYAGAQQIDASDEEEPASEAKGTEQHDSPRQSMAGQVNATPVSAPINKNDMTSSSHDSTSPSNSIVDLRQLKQSHRRDDCKFKKAPCEGSAPDSGDETIEHPLYQDDEGIPMSKDEDDDDGFPMNNTEAVDETASHDGDEELSVSPDLTRRSDDDDDDDDDDEISVLPDQAQDNTEHQSEQESTWPNEDDTDGDAQGFDQDEEESEVDLSLLAGLLGGEPVFLSSDKKKKPSPEIEFRVRDSDSKNYSFHDHHMGVLGHLDKSPSHMSPIYHDNDGSVSDDVSTLGEDGASVIKEGFDDDGEQSLTSHHSFTNNSNSHQGSSAHSRMSHRVLYPPMPLDSLQRLDEIFKDRKHKKKKKSKKPSIPKTITAYC